MGCTSLFFYSIPEKPKDFRDFITKKKNAIPAGQSG